MSILQNTWFVGISTGIISGILVFFATKWIMDKRGKKEYYKQVDSANYSVINALKPYIADKGLPDINIFNALIVSNARIFNVNKKDMYSLEMYCEELIREIISDVYVSNDKKQEYTMSIATYTSNIKATNDSMNFAPVKVIYGERSNTRLVSTMAAFLIAPLGALLGIFVGFSNDKDFLIKVDEFLDVLFVEEIAGNQFSLPSFFAILVILFCLMALSVFLLIMSNTFSEIMNKYVSRRLKKDDTSSKKNSEEKENK